MREELMSVTFAAFRLALINAPFCQAVWRRTQEPKCGELVIEYSHGVHTGDRNALGILVWHDRLRGEGVIRLPCPCCEELEHGSTVRWDNAAFMAVPTREIIQEVDAQLIKEAGK